MFVQRSLPVRFRLPPRRYRNSPKHGSYTFQDFCSDWFFLEYLSIIELGKIEVLRIERHHNRQRLIPDMTQIFMILPHLEVASLVYYGR